MVSIDRGGMLVANRTWLPLNFRFWVAGKQALELLAAQLRSSINAPDARSPEMITESVGLLATTVTLNGHCAKDNNGNKLVKISR